MAAHLSEASLNAVASDVVQRLRSPASRELTKTYVQARGSLSPLTTIRLP